MTGLYKINQELASLTKDLTPVEANNKVKEFCGRAIRKLEAGFQKLEHFFQTLIHEGKGKWETKQERSFNKLVEQLRVVQQDFADASRDFSKLSQDERDLIVEGFKDFNSEIGKQLQSMRQICDLIKRRSDKIDTGKVDNAKGLIEDLIKVCDKEIHPKHKRVEEEKKTPEEKIALRKKEIEERKEERRRVPREKEVEQPPETVIARTGRERKLARSGKKLTKFQKREARYQARLAGTEGQHETKFVVPKKQKKEVVAVKKEKPVREKKEPKATEKEKRSDAFYRQEQFQSNVDEAHDVLAQLHQNLFKEQIDNMFLVLLKQPKPLDAKSWNDFKKNITEQLNTLPMHEINEEGKKLIEALKNALKYEAPQEAKPREKVKHKPEVVAKKVEPKEERPKEFSVERTRAALKDLLDWLNPLGMDNPILNKAFAANPEELKKDNTALENFKRNIREGLQELTDTFGGEGGLLTSDIQLSMAKLRNTIV